MSDVATETQKDEKLEEYFERIRKAEARFTTLVNWHTEAYLAIKHTDLIGGSVDATYINVAQYEERPEYPNEGWNAPLVTNVDATLKLMAQITKFARSKGYKVEKDYDSSDFNLRVKLHDDYGYTVTYYCKRETVCTPKVTGHKVIPAKPAEPPRVVDVIEWECEKISLLGFDTE